MPYGDDQPDAKRVVTRGDGYRDGLARNDFDTSQAKAGPGDAVAPATQPGTSNPDGIPVAGVGPAVEDHNNPEYRN